MVKTDVLKILTVGVLLVLAGRNGRADVELPSVLSDNMVLQRNRAVPVWGSANSGEKVTVSFRNQTLSTTADSSGSWRVDLPTGNAGGPFDMTITGENSLTLKNILVGEVWVCSGQSNMQWNVASSQNAQQEIVQADYPEIRLFTVPCVTSGTPQTDCAGCWKTCSPETIKGFTAVGYFFGRDLYRHVKVPVGLINASWGGTNAETWIPRETLLTAPKLDRLKRMILDAEKPVDYQAYLKEMDGWEKATHRNDPGNSGFAKGWADPDASAEGWQEKSLPGYFDDLKDNNDFDGAVWFRKTVELDESWVGRDLTLELGPIDDFDTTYFNGVGIGKTGHEVKNSWCASRRYTVPGKLVRGGRNVIAVRVFDNFMGGGFGGPASAMKLSRAGQTPISLAGSWQYRIEAEIKPINSELAKPELPRPLDSYNAPCATYNAMIHPLLPYAVKGVIWYQGESNAGRPYEYRDLFPAMIESWREVWGQGDFPFLFVQLANYMAVSDQPSESYWAELREAQAMTLNTSNTGMAVIIDIGEAENIHPKNKQEVGKRLLLAARAKAYGENITYSGPLYESMEVCGGKVVLKFRHVGSGLVARNGNPLKGFTIAGVDKKFVWAQAKIVGETIEVWNEQVPDPVAVRYAWADNPVCNLYNKEGVPASPFRTDDWKR